MEISSPGNKSNINCHRLSFGQNIKKVSQPWLKDDKKWYNFALLSLDQKGTGGGRRGNMASAIYHNKYNVAQLASAFKGYCLARNE